MRRLLLSTFCGPRCQDARDDGRYTRSWQDKDRQIDGREDQQARKVHGAGGFLRRVGESRCDISKPTRTQGAVGISTGGSLECLKRYVG
jgi:hypothetical protein